MNNPQNGNKGFGGFMGAIKRVAGLQDVVAPKPTTSDAEPEAKNAPEPEKRPVVADSAVLMSPEDLRTMIIAAVKASGIDPASHEGVELRGDMEAVLTEYSKFHNKLASPKKSSWDEVYSSDDEGDTSKEPVAPKPAPAAPKAPAQPAPQKSPKPAPAQAPSQPANAPKTVIDDEVAWLLRDSGFYVAIDAAERVGIAKDTLEKWLAKANGYAGRYAQMKAQQASDAQLDTQYKKLEALVTEIYEAVDKA